MNDKTVQKFLNFKINKYEPSKAKSFEFYQLEMFWTNAPNEGEWLVMKLQAVIGTASGIRNLEMTYLLKTDLEIKVNPYDEEKKKYIFLNIRKDLKGNKTKKAATYRISNRKYGGFDFVAGFEKYLELIKNFKTKRLWVNYREKTKRFIDQPMGENNVRETPKNIAVYCEFPNPEQYKGHSWRRTLGTLLAEAGASLSTMMTHARWKGVKTAQGYIDSSSRNQLKVAGMIFPGV